MSKIYIDIDKLTPEYRQRFYQSLEDKIDKLEEENTELKQHCKNLEEQYIKIENTPCPDCANRRYLNRGEVEKLISRLVVEYSNWITDTDTQDSWCAARSDLVNDILNLALPDKDRIIEVLRNWCNDDLYKSIEQVANEILGKPDSVTVTEDDGEY